MGFLAGKRAFIVGVATDRSIAWGIAQAMHREGAELAFSYLNDKDRKSTRLNSSHLVISYAVFCLKKKKKYCSAASLRPGPISFVGRTSPGFPDYHWSTLCQAAAARSVHRCALLPHPPPAATQLVA